MWASNEAATKAGSGTHIAIRIGNLRFDEGFDEQSRVGLMAKSLSQESVLKRRNRTYTLG